MFMWMIVLALILAYAAILGGMRFLNIDNSN